MERLTAHEDLQALLGAYALDAVEPDEAAEIERHLATCPRCRAELVEHREVAGLLGSAGADAPPGVWDRIAAALEQPPPALQLTGLVIRPAGRPSGPADPGVAPLAAGPGHRPNVVPMRRGRRAVTVRAFAALAAVAALVAAVLGVDVVRLNHRTDNLRVALATAPVEAAYHIALTNPGTRRVTLKSTDGTYTMSAVILPDGTGFVGPHNLPALAKGQTYQLWGVVGGDRISLAVIGNTPRIRQFGAPDNVTALAVTAERAGGVVTTRNAPVVAAPVPSAITS